MSDDLLTAAGGFIAPTHLPQTYRITYRVQGRLRRWWFRKQGWSTEWTVEYDPGDLRPLSSMLPRFSAARGGVTISR